MASLVSRALTSFSKKTLNVACNESKTSFLCQSKVGAPIIRDNARFISIMKNDIGVNNKPALCSNSTVLATIKSGYASLHTEGDRRFADLLQQEIEEEKKRSSELPAMSDGWNVNLKGAEGLLTRSQEGDKVEVSFTLNGSVPPINDEGEGDPEDEGSIMSFPDFTVKVTKLGGSKAIEFECYFPEDVQSEVAEESMGMFSVRSAVVYEGEITDETYIIDTENLDPDVYSYFLSYLADRGVDQQFAEEFTELATAAEHQEYIRSLQKLKSFVSGK